MNNSNEYNKLLKTLDKLLGEDGCPWDKKQDNTSIIEYLRSECEELSQALNNKDYDNICEEIGDVLFVLLLMTRHNEKLGKFNLKDVLENINKKLIRRHPHVFAGTTYETEEDLVKQWNRIKKEEKLGKL
ncbi:MAG: nucleotide pyrophosphohydrolase [Desulfotalea sp.]